RATRSAILHFDPLDGGSTEAIDAPATRSLLPRHLRSIFRQLLTLRRHAPRIGRAPDPRRENRNHSRYDTARMPWGIGIAGFFLGKLARCDFDVVATRQLSDDMSGSDD